MIGGGAIGAAVTYALTEAGYPDVQLIEAGELGGATSSRAAGMVGQVRASPERTRLAMTSVREFSTFEDRTGIPVDWRRTGSLRVATTPERAQEFVRLASVATSVGLDVETVDPSRLGELFPLLDPGPVTAALWCPSDGYVQPHSLVTGYVGAARARGATVATHTRVLGIRVEHAAVVGVETDRGPVRASMVVNAAGPWAWEVAAMVGLDLPVVPVRHEYFVTGPVAGWRADLPALRLPDQRIYVRAEGLGLLCGGWEPAALSLDPRRAGERLAAWPEPDWDVLAGFAEALDVVLPGGSEAGIRETFRGWPAFTPDGRFVVGPVPGVEGFVMAAGCNAHGVSGSAGIAAAVVESLGPAPSDYVGSLAPQRFGPPAWAAARRSAQRVYEEYYSMLPPA